MLCFISCLIVACTMVNITFTTETNLLYHYWFANVIDFPNQIAISPQPFDVFAYSTAEKIWTVFRESFNNAKFFELKIYKSQWCLAKGNYSITAESYGDSYFVEISSFHEKILPPTFVPAQEKIKTPVFFIPSFGVFFLTLNFTMLQVV